MKKLLHIICIALPAILFSCRENYIPPVIAAGPSYLVVDGVIANNDTTVFKLSRTVSLNSKLTTTAEAGAQVTVESDANGTFVLKELKTKGTYASTAPLVLNKAAKYRLRIVTNGSNQTYLSDFVPVKDAPPIDSLGYTTTDALRIYVNTHDATNSTRYYRYDFSETWQFRSYFSSLFIPVLDPAAGPGYFTPRNLVTNNINTCYVSVNSTDIELTSTAKLSEDMVYQAPVTVVPSTSQKLRFRYSINVKQYALTEDAFNFWQLVQKNTEQLGSIFDAQPSQVKGNIHNIKNASEPVFGYISAGAIQQKRIFISHAVLPASWLPEDIYFSCTYDPLAELPVPISEYGTYFVSGRYVPISPIFDIYGNLVGYYGGLHECTDCTLRGYNQRPSFWKD